MFNIELNLIMADVVFHLNAVNVLTDEDVTLYKDCIDAMQDFTEKEPYKVNILVRFVAERACTLYREGMAIGDCMTVIMKNVDVIAKHFNINKTFFFNYIKHEVIYNTHTFAERIAVLRACNAVSGEVDNVFYVVKVKNALMALLMLNAGTNMAEIRTLADEIKKLSPMLSDVPTLARDIAV